MSEPPTLHSRRTLSLRFDVPISRTSEFWDSLRKGRFVTTKCSKCGAVSFPPQADCSKCASGEFTWVDVGKEATLLTFTQVQLVPASFAGSGPYIIAIAEFPGGLRVLAWLEGVKREEVKPGMKLKVEARTAGENPYYVFMRA
jgi:uncharacterized OB-fold protein